MPAVDRFTSICIYPVLSRSAMVRQDATIDLFIRTGQILERRLRTILHAIQSTAIPDRRANLYLMLPESRFLAPQRTAGSPFIHHLHFRPRTNNHKDEFFLSTNILVPGPESCTETERAAEQDSRHLLGHVWHDSGRTLRSLSASGLMIMKHISICIDLLTLFRQQSPPLHVLDFQPPKF